MLTTRRTFSPASCAVKSPTKPCWKPSIRLAFHDIAPHAPVHVLVIPKGPYATFDHFAAKASAAEIVDFHRACAKVCEIVGVAPGQGYRAITNAGAHGMQEVPHYHLHILGGKVMGPLIQR